MMVLSAQATAQKNAKDKKLESDCSFAREAFISKDLLMKTLFENATAYVIFPNVGKGGFIVGGAMGNGIVYQKGKPVGKAKLTQLSAGLQAGGQSYSEVIFFENQDVLNKFKENKVEFSASASAVIANEGAAANQNYQDGVMIFVLVKGGLMLEVSAGGQQFKYSEF
jgi:lipid-binding SYLF domain-containing protein